MTDEKLTKEERAAYKEAGVATPDENAKLEHTEGGATTRDGLDLGVPMLPGSPDERQGPEDALGEGPKRGDYRQRVTGTQHHQSVPVTDGDDDGPNARLEPQNPRTEDIGDAEGLKGGVDTDPRAA